MPIFNVDGMA